MVRDVLSRHIAAIIRDVGPLDSSVVKIEQDLNGYSQSVKACPTEFNDITIDNDAFLYRMESGG
jgi:hypothetical protein